jgi:phosphate transport system substrate-binding protein
MIRWIGVVGLAAAVSLVGCNRGGTGGAPVGGQAGGSALISGDGSSTVAPLSEAVAEEFKASNPNVNVVVGTSGTGGGFKKFCAGETDFSNASRPIKESEIQACQQENVAFIELPVAYDGLSVVINPKNDFVDSMTVQELADVWKPDSTVKRWSDIRPTWPNREIHLYGPGTDSGTFDYFTEAIVGKEDASRSDYQASEDDNALVRGIAGDPDALGYFGYAYYQENQDKLKLVAIDAGNGPVQPTPETIQKGTYQPLSRPLFIYVRSAAAERPEVQQFVEFYLLNVGKLAPEVGYVPLSDAVYQAARQRFQDRKTGTMFTSGSDQMRLEELLASPGK